MREFRRLVSLDGKGSDLVSERPRSIFASEESEPSKLIWKGEDVLTKPSSSGSFDDFSFKVEDRLKKPGDEYSFKLNDRLKKPGEDSSWKFDDRLKKSGEEFSWKGYDGLAKPEGLVKPVPANPGGEAFEAWPAKWTGVKGSSTQEAMWKSDMLSKPDSKFMQLQQNMQQENRQFTMVSNIMKTKHDTAKSAINNIR